MKHTREELSQLQGLPLSIKIRMTENRIREWIREYGEDGVYISFSGGKDSTVLMDIIRTRIGYNIPAVFVDVPTQYPELRDFAMTFDNVTVLKPKISFMEVCEKYGFPLISKEVSECVQGARKYLTSILQEQNTLTDRQTDRAAVSVLVRQSYWNGSIPKQEEPGNTTYTNTKRTRFLERADRESMRNPSGGGYDNKYRKLRGIGEYDEARQGTADRRGTQIGFAFGDAHDRERHTDGGEYP